MLMPVAATATIWVRDTKGDIELLVSLVVITMSLGTLIAPTYLYFMSGLTANSIVIPRAAHLAPAGHRRASCRSSSACALNRVLRARLSRVQPYFAFAGNVGLFMAVFLNVGTAAPLLRHLLAAPDRLRDLDRARGQPHQLRARLGRSAASPASARDHQVTCEFSSGMRSNGTALVVGLASFPDTPLVTVPAAIYIIFQHLLAGVVKARLVRAPRRRRCRDGRRRLRRPPAATAPARTAARAA